MHSRIPHNTSAAKHTAGLSITCSRHQQHQMPITLAQPLCGTEASATAISAWHCKTAEQILIICSINCNDLGCQHLLSLVWLEEM